MIGANRPRMLSIALPHVDAWNTWWDEFGNDPTRFAELNAGTGAAAELVGRDPREVERSACLLVAVDPSSQERQPNPDAPAVPLEELGAALQTLAEGGADEVILVASPITEASVRELADALPS
jgi:alkanesulfonate monooxygenase SsuD/methylene tetrahydromethanopterin reductase-like flavin-dependent oxidoreductase (luciferase family)